jgi:Domain of unknown function (DUF4402)
MMKSIAGAGAILGLLLIASPAAAVSPLTQATANAKIYKPLTISKVQNLDFGVIVLTGASFSSQSVVMNQSGIITTCGGAGSLTCSGSTQPATYHLVGTANAFVTITSPGFNLANGAATLPFAPAFTSPVQLSSGGALDISLGGTVSGLANTTPDGVYTGNFAVTADYQ